MCPGDRVAIAMRNRPEWAVAFVATTLLGAIPAPLNSFGLREELHAALADLAPKVLFCDPERHARIASEGAPALVTVVTDGALAGTESYAALVAQPAEPPPVANVGPDDPALILFTSGATSRAKGVLSTQRAVCQALFNIDFIGALSAMSSPEAVARISSTISSAFCSRGTRWLRMSPQFRSMSSGMAAASRSFVASLIVGAGFEPKAEPRPVVNTTSCAPPAIWPVADTGS